MKVQALYTGYSVTAGKIYDVIFEYDTVYELECDDEQIYCRPKGMFGIVTTPKTVFQLVNEAIEMLALAEFNLAATKNKMYECRKAVNQGKELDNFQLEIIKLVLEGESLMVMRKTQKTLDNELIYKVCNIFKDKMDVMEEEKLKINDCRKTIADGKELDATQRAFLEDYK
jgi:hypothetical protein